MDPSKGKRIAMSKALFAVIAALLWSAPAFADGAIVPGDVELYPTWSAVGIELPYSGDDDATASAEFVWRVAGDDAWRNGVDMTIDRARKVINASIWPLEQGAAIETRITVSDSGAVVATLDTPTVTRAMVLQNSGGRVYYVSPSGDDSSAGSKDAPFRTLAQGASVAAAGDTVYAMSGVYHEGELFAGLQGLPDKPIIIAAAPGEHPVLDGSMEIPRGSGIWSKWEDIEGVYYAVIEPETFDVAYVAQDGQRMFPLLAGADIMAGKLRIPWGGESPIGRSWHYDPFEFMLFIRTGDASTPSEHSYSLGVLSPGIKLHGSQNVVIKGFEIRFFGQAGVRISGGSTGCIVTECYIHNVPVGVLLRDADTRGNAVWRNEIDEPGLADFAWGAIKGSEYPRQGTRIKAGRGTSICYNRISGFFDAIEADSWSNPTRFDLNRDMDIMFNECFNIGDDGTEPDGGGVNLRIHGNRFRNCHTAISLAPVERGPVYCTRNDASYRSLMFKLNVGGCLSLGWAYCYQNSGYCQSAGRGGTAVSFPSAQSMPISNKVFRNNAILANGQGIRYAHSGYSLDYDCYYHVPGGKPLQFSWQVSADGKWTTDRYEAFADFVKASGQETHGLYADPGFIFTPDAGSIGEKVLESAYISDVPLATGTDIGDLRLESTSPCIDAGAVIRGINEDFLGSAPDIGAFEMR